MSALTHSTFRPMILRWLCLLYLFFSLPSAHAQSAFLETPAARQVGTELDAQMRRLAISLLDQPEGIDPLSRWRLQAAAGRYAEALASIEALRVQRPGASGQPPLFLPHELHLRARLAEATGADYISAWREAFATRFGGLSDREAQRAIFSFGTAVPRLRGELEAALAKTTDRAQLPAPEAMELLRAWQLHDAYAAFQPLVIDALRADNARRYVIEPAQLVPAGGGTLIHTLVIRPRGKTGLTTLHTHTIYANDGWAEEDALRAAAHGYAGVVSYTRGKGHSPGPVVPYVHEGSDAAAVIDWIAAQPWSDGRVGLYGGSYSGFTAWAAAKQRPRALKAIAASATVAPGIDVPMEGGVFLNFVYPWPHYATSNPSLNDALYGDNARWAALSQRWYASGGAYRKLSQLDGLPNPWFKEWLQHPRYDAYWQRLIPQGADYAALDLPVLATTGYFDGGQIGALHYFREHLKAKTDANHRLLIGPFEHFAMQRGVPPVVQGYATDPAARIDLQALRLQWFDHVLKGAPLPALLAGRINWQVMGANRWRHANSLDAMPMERRRLHLVPEGLRDKAQPKAQSLQTVDFRDRRDAAWSAPDTVLIDALPAQAGLVFESEPLSEPLELAGALEGELHFRINKRDVDLALSVYERTAQGQYLELAGWLQRASQAADRRQRQLLRPGELQRLVLRDTRLLGRQLAAGSRLVLTLGAVKQPDRQLNLGSGKEPADETLRDAGAPLRLRVLGSSFVDWPVRRTED